MPFEIGTSIVKNAYIDQLPAKSKTVDSNPVEC
jgi:hypothetical protein